MVNHILPPSQQKSSTTLTPINIRMVPELNTAVLATKKKRDRELLLWYLIRELSKHLDLVNGRFDVDEAIDILVCQLDIYSRRTFYRILKRGEGIFWETYINSKTGSHRIKIYGLPKLCERFSIRPSRFRTWPIRDFACTLARKRAILWNASAYRTNWQSNNNHPISRQSLTGKTGMERRQQQRYDATIATYSKETPTKYREQGTYKLKREMMTVHTKHGPIQIPKQIGNRFYSWATRSNVGMCRRIRRVISDRQGPFSADEVTHKGTIARRFFSTFRSYIKAFMRKRTDHFEAYYYPSLYDDRYYLRAVVW